MRTALVLASSACDSQPAHESPNSAALLHAADFQWVASGDSARPMTNPPRDDVLATVRLFVDDAGTLRRYQYSPISQSGDWADELTIRLGDATHATGADRRATTFATACSPLVHIEEHLVARGDSLIPASRTLRNSSDIVLSDPSCGESMPPLPPLPTQVDSLVARKLVPRNWRALARSTRTAPHDSSARGDVVAPPR